jgi:geranylgeranyl reductase family protein
MPDVIIVGAGPAGTSAAYTLACGGADVLLLDRMEFPRDKTCGDGLTPASVERLVEMGVDLSDARTVRGYSFIHTRSDRRTDEMFRGGIGTKGAAIRRHLLDERTLQAALAAGAKLGKGTVSGLVRDESRRVCGVDFIENGRRRRLYAAVTLIAAGAAGRVLFARDDDQRIWSVAGRTYVTLEPAQSASLDHLELYFPLALGGRTVPGYAWIFPVSETHANIGAGIARTDRFRGVSIRELLIAFATEHAHLSRRQIAEVVDGEISTAPLAIGESTSAAPGVLLCGDAAGLGNPFTGEGIAGALLSGDAAARAILDASRDGEGWERIAADYDATLGRLLKRNVRLVGTIRATLDKPEFFHGRAADLCFARGRRCQAWIRRIIHDETRSEELPRATLATEVVVEQLRSDLVRAATACEPLFGPLLEECLADNDITLGAIVSAAVTVFAAAGEERLEELTRVASVLEVARLVDALHRGLPEATAIERREEWGCNTTELVLADVLNANALRMLAALAPAWSQALCGRLAEHFAVRSCDNGQLDVRPSLLDDAAVAEILTAVGLGAVPGEVVPPHTVRRVHAALGARSIRLRAAS